MKTEFCYGCMRKRNFREKVCPVCGYKHPLYDYDRFALAPGTVLKNGKYILGRLLKSGAFSFIYIAVNTETLEKAAVKQFFPERIGLETEMEQRMEVLHFFSREAEMLGSLAGISGTLQIKDFFYEKDTAFIVENLVEGHTLFEKSDHLKIEDCLNELYPVMETLALVHKRNVIHCDLCQENIMVDRDGNKWIIDFGSARRSGEKLSFDYGKTIDPDYYPPELQKRGKPAGSWTDVFLMCRLILNSVEKIPSAVSAVLRKGMSPDIHKRYQSMIELENALKNALAESETKENNKRQPEDPDTPTIITDRNEKETDQAYLFLNEKIIPERPLVYEIYFDPYYSSEQSAYFYYLDSREVGISDTFGLYPDHTALRFGDLWFSSKYGSKKTNHLLIDGIEVIIPLEREIITDSGNVAAKLMFSENSCDIYYGNESIHVTKSGNTIIFNKNHICIARSFLSENGKIIKSYPRGEQEKKYDLIVFAPITRLEEIIMLSYHDIGLTRICKKRVMASKQPDDNKKSENRNKTTDR